MLFHIFLSSFIVITTIHAIVLPSHNNYKDGSSFEDSINANLYQLDMLISPFPEFPQYSLSSIYSDNNCDEKSIITLKSYLMDSCFFDVEQVKYYSYSCSSDGLVKTLYSDENCLQPISKQLIGTPSCQDGMKVFCDISNNPYHKIPNNWLVEAFYQTSQCQNILNVIGYPTYQCISHLDNDISIYNTNSTQEVYLNNNNCSGSPIHYSYQSTCEDYYYYYSDQLQNESNDSEQSSNDDFSVFYSNFIFLDIMQEETFYLDDESNSEKLFESKNNSQGFDNNLTIGSTASSEELMDSKLYSLDDDTVIAYINSIFKAKEQTTTPISPCPHDKHDHEVHLIPNSNTFYQQKEFKMKQDSSSSSSSFTIITIAFMIILDGLLIFYLCLSSDNKNNQTETTLSKLTIVL